MISYIGVPSIRSAPDTISTVPRFCRFSILSSFTEESPIGFGLYGERVANTPMRLFPPRRGGFTIGDQRSAFTSLKPHMSHICE